ncbi:MAG: CDGSH iron-sulfur domain-containing protein [Planctomycetota bacterium]
MDQPKIAACFPKQIQLEAGKSYAYCTCGHSSEGALCDGSHKDTAFKPNVFVAEKDETVWVCQCKQTGNAPLCDGTHNGIQQQQAPEA